MRQRDHHIMSVAASLRTGFMLTLLLGAASGVAFGQGLPGLPGMPAPPNPVEVKVNCSAKNVKEMERQLEQLETLQSKTPETIGLFCAGIELVAKVMDWKDDEPLPPAINDLAKDILKQDITPRMVKAMCRRAEGEVGRNIRTEIGQLKDKLQTCKGV